MCSFDRQLPRGAGHDINVKRISFSRQTVAPHGLVGLR